MISYTNEEEKRGRTGEGEGEGGESSMYGRATDNYQIK